MPRCSIGAESVEGHKQVLHDNFNANHPTQPEQYSKLQVTCCKDVQAPAFPVCLQHHVTYCSLFGSPSNLEGEGGGRLERHDRSQSLTQLV
eukprot:3151859-Amphidinium_carterae.1